nr:hypothetical protein Iba_chr12cCG3370 [Ipomoea batatas]GME00705.1 hypothetical protein Iba_contig119CG0010 [Ipomoea batatas]
MDNNVRLHARKSVRVCKHLDGSISQACTNLELCNLGHVLLAETALIISRVGP